jgi:uncharacterized protein YqhQ
MPSISDLIQLSSEIDEPHLLVVEDASGEPEVRGYVSLIEAATLGAIALTESLGAMGYEQTAREIDKEISNLLMQHLMLVTLASGMTEPESA